MPPHLFRHGAAVILTGLLAACGGSGGGGGPSFSITASAPSGNTDETGATATFTVVLDVAPSAAVTVAVSSADTGEVTIQEGASLDFTPSNWHVPQTVTVIGVNDEEVDGTVTVTVTATAGSSGGYDGESDAVQIANADDGREMWPSKDNTLYEHTMNPAEWSNGAGQHMFAGQIGSNAVAPMGVLRRSLLAFDIASVVPANATITSAVLRLNVSRVRNVAANVSLHRMLMDWGEGGSDAPGVNTSSAEGGGSDGATLPDAEANEATWTHRMHGGGAAAQWANTAGGQAGTDYVATASDTQSVNATGTYTWSGTLVDDVRLMFNDPASNYGWIVIGEEGTLQSVKRFDTRENPITANRPILIIDYTTP
jgi:hypothetical protein